MEALTQQDFQKVLNFVQGLYSTDSLQNFADYVSTGIANLIQVNIAGYSTHNLTQGQFLGGALVPACLIQSETVSQYSHEHPHHKYYLKTRDCQARALSDFLSEKQLHQREGLYQKFLRPMNMEELLAIILPHSNPLVVDAISLLRDRRDFTERDRLILNLLLPHFMQARQTGQVFVQLQQENKQLQRSLTATGSIIISNNGDVQHMSSKAENWLQQYFSSDSNQSLPDHLRQWVKYQKTLHHSDRSVAKPHLPMKIEQEGKQLVIRLIADPMNDQSILILEEQVTPSLTIESLEYLGLSKREAEVLFWIAKGKENVEISRILYVNPATVRKHLEHIYQKLKVTTRTAAVVAALQKLGML